MENHLSHMLDTSISLVHIYNKSLQSNQIIGLQLPKRHAHNKRKTTEQSVYTHYTPPILVKCHTPEFQNALELDAGGRNVAELLSPQLATQKDQELECNGKEPTIDSTYLFLT